MTVKRTPFEQQKYEMVVAVRAAIRLKHRIMADRELNEVLPAAEAAFDVAVQQGKLPEEVDVQAIADSVVPGASV